MERHNNADCTSGAARPDSSEWRPATARRLWVGRRSQFPGDGVARLLLRRYSKYVGRAVLDVGAGMGGPTRLLPKAVGLDLEPRQPRSIGGDLALMPFRSEVFDTVFSIEVLEHLADDHLAKGLHEIARVMRPGAYGIFVTPYREDLSSRMTVCPHCGTRFHWLGHVQSFDEDSLGGVVQRVGLRVVDIRTMHLAFKGQHRLLGMLAFLLEPLGFRQARHMAMVVQRPA